MDYIFRYPLNKAHYYQRQAESKEINRQFSSAKKLRELALENLNTSLTLSSNEIIQGNIRLQIAHERKQIERLEKLCTGDLEPLVKNINFKTNMTHVKGYVGPAVPENMVNSTVKAGPPYFRSLIVEVVRNAEKMNEIIQGMESKVDIVTNCDNELPNLYNQSIDKSNTDVLSDLKCANSERLSLNLQPMLQQLNEINNKTLLLSSKLMQEFSSLQLENKLLSEKLDSLKSSDNTSTQDELRKGSSSFMIYPLGESYKPSPLSMEDFAPLDCPPMDFLNAKNKTSYT